MSDGDDVSDLNMECWGGMDSQSVMSFLKSVIFLDVMKVISSNSDASSHLGGDDDSLEDLSSNGNAGGEWALLIDVGSFDSGGRGLEAKANIFIISDTFLCFRVHNVEVLVVEDTRLLLESLLSLPRISEKRHLLVQPS